MSWTLSPVQVKHNALRMTAVAVVVTVAGCGGGITEPKCDRCAELRVVTDRPEYRPGTNIAFTITNRTSSVLRYDWCSVGLASRGSGDDFPPAVYSPSRRCGFGAGMQDVLDHMVLVEPGENLRDSVAISTAAHQSQYRITIWLLDESGVRQPGNPVVSNTFDVFPAASAALSR
jgi:hypothetical protein